MKLFIERLGVNGEGVAHHKGYTVFVDGALPGEEVHAHVYERHKSYGRATIVELLKTSPFRAKPACPLFSKCGGCQLMHLEYQKQLEAKRQKVVDALERIGKLTDFTVLPCEPSPSSFHYRNKIQLPMDENGRLGLFARNTHEIVPIEDCLIHSDLGQRAFEHVQRIISQYIPKVTENLRHVLIKTGVHTSQVLVILVTREDQLLTDLGVEIMKAMPEIKGVVQNINPKEGNVILSDRFETLAGQGYIEERLSGLVFKISPASFFQVNPAQAEKLYQKALELAGLEGKEVVLDAYCGVGTLSLFLAQRAKEVIGVECVKEAIIDAEHNSRLNGISNVAFQCAQTEKFVSSLKKVDVAVLNPPRKGCERAVLEALVRLKTPRIVYISCDSATLARDLQFLCQNGYRVDIIQPFDMFPQTAHVETIVNLKASAT